MVPLLKGRPSTETADYGEPWGISKALPPDDRIRALGLLAEVQRHHR